MQVKTFEGFSMQEAVKAVRKEFGGDAVILRTKEKPMDNGKSKIFEVTAAVAQHNNRSAGGSVSRESGSGGELHELTVEILNLKTQVAGLSDNYPGRDRLLNLEAGLCELRSLLLQNLKGINGTIYEGLNTPMVELIKKLEYTGIDLSYLTQLIAALKSLPEPEITGNSTKAQLLEEQYKTAAIKWMLGKIKIAPDFNNVADSLGVHVFVGATGVGKTTAIAKLAAHYKVKEKLQVVVGSFDNTRLAAAEQMRIYSKLIDVPFVQLDDVKDIDRLLDTHGDASFILIDTAGRSPKRGKLDEILPLKNLNVPVDFHLVLSATEKQDQMERTVRNFSSLGLSSLLFTKLDETWSYGEIFNLTQKWSVPLSYFSIGQNVPEDFERASKERVIERVFNL